MDKQESVGLLHTQVKVSTVIRKNNLFRSMALVRIFLYALFFKYRFLHRPSNCFGLWFTTLTCEMSLALLWLLSQSLRYFPIERQTFPERLSCRLPPVDIFVTTANPLKEPLIITMNTVLSALAIDYPPAKIACYISDDGASAQTFWALVETSRFARQWLPFCKQFGIEPRAPKEYFGSNTPKIRSFADKTFEAAFQMMQRDYVIFEGAVQNIVTSHSIPNEILRLLDGQPQWPATDPRDHPSIFKVILDHNCDMDVEKGPVPSLFYVSREKKRHVRHRFKAGAMNSLVRISGLITNSPFILNLDCDTYVNNSKAILHALCFFTDPTSERQVSFVQFPQRFYGVDKDDIYGNRMKATFDVLVAGMDGVQGPLYCGTGCIHRRAALYESVSEFDLGWNFDNKLKGLNDNGQSFFTYEHLRNKFGRSNAVVLSVCKLDIEGPRSREQDMKDVLDVISCDYENETEWGNEVGWIYGSNTEDVLTGLKEHSQGWRSIYCRPYPDCFIGCAPTNGPDVLTWRKRAAIGLLEILFNKHSPLKASGRNRLMLLQRFMYLYICISPLTSILFLYAALQGIHLISGRAMTPRASDPSFALFGLLFVFVYLNSFIQSRLLDTDVKSWWNEERMSAISSVSSYLFGVFEVSMKLMGLSETVFVVTPKKTTEQKAADNEGSGCFVFNSSPLFIPPTALAILNCIAVLVGIIRALRGGLHTLDALFGQLFCCCWVIFNLYPFVKGMVKRGDEGIPLSTILKSAVIALCCLYGAQIGGLHEIID